MTERNRNMVTRPEWSEGREDDRAEQGVLHAGMREDWRTELRLELRSFKNEMRVLMVATLAILKLDLPRTLTVGAMAAFGLKAAVGFIHRN